MDLRTTSHSVQVIPFGNFKLAACLGFRDFFLSSLPKARFCITLARLLPNLFLTGASQVSGEILFWCFTMLDILHTKMAFQSFMFRKCCFTLYFSCRPYLPWNTRSEYTTTETWPNINKKQAAYIMSSAGKTFYIPALYLPCIWHYIAFVPCGYWLLFSPELYKNPWLLAFPKHCLPTMQACKFAIYKIRGNWKPILWTFWPKPWLSIGTAFVKQQGKSGMSQNKESWYIFYSFFLVISWGISIKKEHS